MPRRPALRLAALLAGAVLLTSGCSLPDPGGAGAGRPGGEERQARVTPRRAGPTWATGAPVRVVMNDRFRYRPDTIMVRAGRRVTFSVTNVGKLPHEFVLGDRAIQLDHERRMRLGSSDGGHAHSHGYGGHGGPSAGGVTVPPGETRRLTWTFDEPGMVLYGCHVVGHWAAGMKGTVVVLAPDGPVPP
jgi:uncharacterized cupredoxin-like copper-binding protein